MKPCACGYCDELIPDNGKGNNGKIARFKKGHVNRGKHNASYGRNADQAFHWNGGKKIQTQGYILIYKPNHHFADIYGYVREHRVVYEEYYNCCLLETTLIHHKNGDIKDNRIENLEPFTWRQHAKEHHFLEGHGSQGRLHDPNTGRFI